MEETENITKKEIESYQRVSPTFWLETEEIKTETGQPLDFELHRYLFDIYEDDSPFLCCIKAGQIGFCLHPDTKVLTADYKWIKIKDLKLGQKLVSVDESAKGQRHGRKMRVATVEGKKEVFEESYRITMEDGRVLTATGKHRFLSQLRSSTTSIWRQVEKMRVGDTIRNFSEVWNEYPTYEDGWVAGALDGEASLRHKTGAELTFVQQPNKGILERMRLYLEKNNYTFRDVIRKKSGFKSSPNPIGELTLSRTDEIFKIIGKTKPSRFVNRTDWWEGNCIPGNSPETSWIKIVDIVKLYGKQPMIDLQTSTKTFIAEGFVSHNSTFAIFKTMHMVKFKHLDVGYILPTVEMVQKFVGSKVNRIAQQNSSIQEMMKDKDSITQKQIGENYIFYLGAQTDRSAIMLSLDMLVADEYDKAPQEILEIYDSRLQHSKFGYKYVFSNPTIPDFGVDRFWEISDKKKWFIQCDSCSERYVLDEECIDYEAEIYRCPKCKAEITDENRRLGEWVPTANGKWSGYWIPLWLNPLVPASKITEYKHTKTKEYFANFVAGLPYINTSNMLSEAILDTNLIDKVNTQEGRIIIGVDTGHNIHYTLANKDGIFYYGYCESVAEKQQAGYDPYDELEKVLIRYPRSIMVADQGGDLIGIRKLQAKYIGRVFLCWFVKETKNLQIIRWAENDEEGKVLVDRNRMVQSVVDEWNERRFPIWGKKEDWLPFYKHCLNIYRVKEISGQDENDPQYGWRWIWKRKGPDHWLMSTVYARVGLDRFAQDLAQIVKKTGGLAGVPRAWNIKETPSGPINPYGDLYREIDI